MIRKGNEIIHLLSGRYSEVLQVSNDNRRVWSVFADMNLARFILLGFTSSNHLCKDVSSSFVVVSLNLCLVELLLKLLNSMRLLKDSNLCHFFLFVLANDVNMLSSSFATNLEQVSPGTLRG